MTYTIKDLNDNHFKVWSPCDMREIIFDGVDNALAFLKDRYKQNNVSHKELENNKQCPLYVDYKKSCKAWKEREEELKLNYVEPVEAVKP